MPEETVLDADDQATPDGGEAVDSEPQDDTDGEQDGDSQAGDPSDEDAAGSDDEDGEGDDGDSDEGVLSEAEFNRLKDNPVALRKALNRGFTRKMQELAPFRRFMNQYNQNPQAAVAALAAGLGMQVGSGSKPESAPAASRLDGVKQKLEQKYGKEVADNLFPLIKEVATAVAGEEVESVRAAQQQIQAAAAEANSKATLKAFEAKHPDWKKYEPAMVKIARTLKVAEGADEGEYLEDLYTLAKSRSNGGSRVAGAIRRMAEKAGKPTAKPTSVPGRRVSKGPTGRTPTFDEAFEAASRGEVFD